MIKQLFPLVVICTVTQNALPAPQKEEDNVTYASLFYLAKNNKKKKHKVPPLSLIEAVTYNKTKLTKKFSKDNLQDINSPNKKKSTPLHIAVENDNIRNIKTLVRNGADLKIPNKNGLDPYQKALLKYNYKACKTLAASGAPIHNDVETQKDYSKKKMNCILLNNTIKQWEQSDSDEKKMLFTNTFPDIKRVLFARSCSLGDINSLKIISKLKAPFTWNDIIRKSVKKKNLSNLIFFLASMQREHQTDTKKIIASFTKLKNLAIHNNYTELNGLLNWYQVAYFCMLKKFGRDAALNVLTF